jgi:Uracil phosphoribosyltransferase
MVLHDLSLNNSELSRFVAEIRDIDIQNDRLRFRRNLERIGEVMAYEISKTFTYSSKVIQTPLGISHVETSDNPIVIATVLWAGLPFHQGFLNILDKAENAFVSAFRKYKDEEQFEICSEYLASPGLDGKTLIIADPMLATGSSLEMAYNILKTKGAPTHTYIACVIASQPAVDYFMEKFSEENVSLWVAAIDPELDAHAYIIPGLGDAGDLAFGEKE